MTLPWNEKGPYNELCYFFKMLDQELTALEPRASLIYCFPKKISYYSYASLFLLVRVF